MMSLIIPKGYKSSMNIRQTEVAIKKVKDFFERDLAIQLNLTRVSAPLFVPARSGMNDTLNGIERPVNFTMLHIPEAGEMEIVQSLAKWKRDALKRYGFYRGEGLYTDMNAIRRDEEPDNLHSLFVDQWDWEKVIGEEDRNLHTLKAAVCGVYEALKHTETYMHREYDFIPVTLPEEIFFITAQELEDMYPDCTSKERERRICRDRGAVFVMQIGDRLKSGVPHDGRAPDYDDWSLNGDILVDYPLLDTALELSSMGIRVDRKALLYQLQERNQMERIHLPFHEALLAGELPLTMGGGIGQSRMCMYFLRKAHVGEVQSGIWPEDMQRRCSQAGIHLL